MLMFELQSLNFMVCSKIFKDWLLNVDANNYCMADKPYLPFRVSSGIEITL